MAFYQIAINAAFAISAVLLSLALVRRTFDRRRATARQLAREAQEDIYFLFDGDRLIDATPSARGVIGTSKSGETDWDLFIRQFEGEYPRLRQHMAQLHSLEAKTLTSLRNTQTTLSAEVWDGYVRIGISGEAPAPTVDVIADEEPNNDLIDLISDNSPDPIWQEDELGKIKWANRAYLELCDASEMKKAATIKTWPPRELFPDLDDEEKARRYLSLGGHDKPRCYEISTKTSGKNVFRFATDVSKLVNAEETQHSYVSALVQTFAQLSTGLAIFDGDKRLKIFNPALHDTLGLAPAFLASKPSLGEFLERLHEGRMLPDLKPNMNWADAMADIQSDLISGAYNGDWRLSNGQTLNVSSRPHPNNATALLFEDISAEKTVARRFRSELETSQLALDHIDDAIAVFTAAGTLTMANRAYYDLWHHGNEAGLIGHSLVEETRLWQRETVVSGLWARIRDNVIAQKTSAEFSETIRLTDGRSTECRVTPMPKGDSMIRFSHPEFIAERKLLHSSG